jgi:pimeloyl-ACP methyl ester carboxylesterase
MRRALLALWLVAAACGSQTAANAPAQPALAPTVAAAPVPPAQPAFTPTSFTVQVHGTGRPIVLVPGLGCPGDVWADTVAHFATGWQVHVLTLAGFAGQPAMTGDAPLVKAARDELIAYIKDRKLDHPVIIGHSLGAFLSMWVAATAPDIVGPVVAVDGAAYIGNGDDSGARAFRDKVLAWSDAEWAQSTREMFAAMVTDKVKAEPMITAVLRSDRHAFANAFYELMSTDIRKELPKITAPVQALLSDSPYAQMIKTQLEAIPQHDIRIVAKTRHFVMFDDPPAYFAAVDAFLAAHPK